MTLVRILFDPRAAPSFRTCVPLYPTPCPHTDLMSDLCCMFGLRNVSVCPTSWMTNPFSRGLRLDPFIADFRISGNYWVILDGPSPPEMLLGKYT